MSSPKDEFDDLRRSRLPLWIAAGAFAVFLATLNHWASAKGLHVLGWVGGWDTMPAVFAPLTWLVTRPFAQLPPAMQPAALNVFNALLAAATLGMLARSVILLPHDRTREQRRAEKHPDGLLTVPGAWIPAVFAAAVAGLQLTFWEHATQFTGEMLDLCVFAFCIWSLLEYRFDERPWRLGLMAFVYGLGVTNNVAMIAFFPAFALATIWIAGFRVLRPGNLFPLLLCGIAGLLLYLLLPAVAVLGDGPYTFWQVLKTNLSTQKGILINMPRWIPLLTGLTSVVPVALIGIKWSSSLGDISNMAKQTSTLLFRVGHVAFFLACLLVAFDPQYSPRELGLGFAWLPYYYLGALAAGYFSGYLLLVGQTSRRPWDELRGGERTARVLAAGSVQLLAITVPVALALYNFPVIHAANGPLLKTLADRVLDTVPPETDLLLVDRMHADFGSLVTARLRERRMTNAPVVVRSDLLYWKFYQKRLATESNGRWPDVLAGGDAPAVFSDDTLQRLMSLAIVSNSITYLHPSFGYYFEKLHATPRGPVWTLRPLTPADGIEPPLGPEVVEAATKWWQTAIPELGPLARQQHRGNPNLQLAGAHYAMLLNTWGASLLQLAKTNDALRAFATAEALNPENIAATINKQYVENLIAGAHDPVKADQRVNNLFGKKYRSWDTVLGLCGPVEEPGFLLTLARTLWKNGLNRQAAARFQRLTLSQPGQPVVWLGFAESLFNASLFPRALDVLAETHRRFPALAPALRAEAVRIEAWSRFHGGDPRAAEDLLLAELSQNASPSPVVLEALGQVYLLTGRTKLAAETMDRQLAKEPDHPRALLNRAALAIQMGDPRGAVAPLDHLLTLVPSNAPALFNRATAHLQLTNLDAAERDYRLLSVVAPRQASAVFGLGEVCWQAGRFAEAAEHFTRYMGMTPTNAAGRAQAAERIAEAAKLAGAK